MWHWRGGRSTTSSEAVTRNRDPSKDGMGRHRRGSRGFSRKRGRSGFKERLQRTVKMFEPNLVALRVAADRSRPRLRHACALPKRRQPEVAAGSRHHIENLATILLHRPRVAIV